MKGPPENVQTPEEDIITNPYSRIEEAIEKKRRNLEKRKIKLLQYSEDERNGKKLTDEQLEARSRIGEVETQLEFIKDIMKMLSLNHREFSRASKQREEVNKKNQAERERKCLSEFLNYQYMLKFMSRVQVKKAFANGTNGAIKLDEDERRAVEGMRGYFLPSAITAMSQTDWLARCEESARNAHAIVMGTKEKLHDKMSGKNLKDLLERIGASEYIQEMKALQLNWRKDSETEKPNAEPEVEPVKKDPKVIFVYGESDLAAHTENGEAAEATTTEFGFEGYAPQMPLIIPEPPPPIPLPPELHSALNGSPYVEDASTEHVWAPSEKNGAGDAKPETAAGKPPETAEHALTGEQSSTHTNRGEKKARGFRGNTKSRNGIPREGNGFLKPYKEDDRSSREFRDSTAGQTRFSGRSGRGSMKGNSRYSPRGGPRSYNNYGYSNGMGYSSGSGGGSYNSGFNSAYSYSSINPPRQAGFNFSSGPIRNNGNLK